ncbi:MAG: pyridoxal phosphate-dependent aminotransferase [Rhodobacteraceae bacterium]|nr:pyridoxal phosphate-dependent aminotransferase [Paracoccaceae bacterium]MCF8514919.1 pyridoxal phosphate-dependent aminotransferase [Paracoccaceae bacterium]MCF8519163.1 pyridoxal phosphate-dependent aminotransferase [Paracoccaceae bacterium]
MKITIHKLFEYLLETADPPPEAFLGFSLSTPPVLGDFLADLDPGLSLDWNGQSFQGLPALRERVIDQAGLGGLCAAKDVLITAGAAEANYLCFRQLLQAGDHLVTETPGWPQAAVMAKAIGTRLTCVPRRAEAGWDLDLDALSAAVTPDTRMIFLSNPNNPTGRLLPAESLQAIAAIADRVGAWLVVDEVYAGLEWSGPRPPSIAGVYDRGISTGSVSKALGLQGIRTGWMICRDPGLIMDAVIARENSSEIMNILGEHIAEIALRPERLGPALSRARQDGARTLARLNDFIESEPRLSWTAPEAGLIGLARLHGLAAEPFAKHLLADPYRTFLLPGTAYDQPAHIRLGVGGGAAANLDEGLRRLSACLTAWPG